MTFFEERSGFPKMPTNGDAAKRPYCRKHSRAMIDIGGEKKCVACRDEQRAQEAARNKTGEKA